jgi:hypothetical protein
MGRGSVDGGNMIGQFPSIKLARMQGGAGGENRRFNDDQRGSGPVWPC